MHVVIRLRVQIMRLKQLKSMEFSKALYWHYGALLDVIHGENMAMTLRGGLEKQMVPENEYP